MSVMSVVLVIFGALMLMAGAVMLALMRRAWQSRSSWQSDSSGMLIIPVRDRARMGGGTVVATFGANATAFGILLLVANSVGA